MRDILGDQGIVRVTTEQGIVRVDQGIVRVTTVNHGAIRCAVSPSRSDTRLPGLLYDIW